MTERDRTLELIAQAKAGDRAAFDRLAGACSERLRASLLRWSRFRIGPEIDLDDVMQDTLLRAFRSLPRFEPRDDDAFCRWLCGVARHALLTARVTEFAGRTGSAVGLTLREDRPPDEAAGVAHASLLLVNSSGGRFWFLRREAHGESTRSPTRSPETFTLPAWVRLERTGGEIIGSYATVDPPSAADWKVLQRVPDFLPGETPILGGIAANGKDPGPETPFVALEAAVCLVEEAPPPRFLRGDANDDGRADISDAIFILASLFLGDADPPCLAAANANGDGAVDISDAAYLLGHLFLGSSPPPAPFPSCGPVELEADRQLGCDVGTCL